MENTKKESIFMNGFIKQNPILVMLLGLCPVLGTSETLNKAIGMSVAVLFVLFFSNLIVSLIKSFVPNEIRIPVYIIIIAALVTIIDMLLKAYTPELSKSLGAFIALITVNCIILGRAEAFASKNSVGHSLLDALGMSAGFALVVITLAFFREMIGTGGWEFVNPFTNTIVFSVHPFEAFKIPLVSQNAGAFLMLGLFIGLFNTVQNIIESHKLKKAAAVNSKMTSKLSEAK